MKQLQIVLSILLCLMASAAQATQRNLMVTNGQAQKRVALVIGNAVYQGAPALRNPVNDARAMSNALNGLGFEVIEVTDATQKEMNRAITTFGSKLNADTAALFFYAGHGLQVKGKNYIVPVDAQIDSESAVSTEAVSIDAVLDQLNVSPVSIVILDACRNNPFERSFRKMGDGGLAQMDAPKGSFIAYATAPGKTAADGVGKNGLFTQELLKQINTPGLTLESVFKRVRSNVASQSGDAQMPWDSSSMTGEFYFKPSKDSQVPSLEPIPSPAHVKSNEEIEQDSWESARNSNDIDAIKEYIIQYPNGRFVGQAKIIIATLKKSSGQTQQLTEAGQQQIQQAEAPKGFVSQGGLTWMPINSSRRYRYWAEANAYCNNTAINGQTGWRLPTKNELQALYASGAVQGQGWTLGNTWSSTPIGIGDHYIVSLFSVGISYFSAILGNYVTCVR